MRADPRSAAGDPGAVVRRVMGCTRRAIATPATTIGGVPALLLFVGADVRPSLAIVLVGGITGASVVALLLVPAAMILVGGGGPARTGTAHAVTG